MEDKTKLKIKYIYYIFMWLYVIVSGIFAWTTSYKIDYLLLFEIFFLYIVFGGIVSIVYKFNIFTTKGDKFSNVSRASFSWFMAILFILFGIFSIVIFSYSK